MVKKMAKPMTLPVGIAIGIATSIAIAIGCCMLVAYFIANERIALSALTPVIAAIHLLSAFIGSVVATSLIKQKKMITAMGTGLGQLLVLLALTALVFEGQYQGIIPSLIAVLAGSGGTVLLRTKGKNSPVRRNRKPAYR